ncbi:MULTISPECIES: protein Gly1ORF1 [Neisseria]|uniref:protein Gly1ORF1 n=1 Tax=Neisseria TaxID=482 RepID=UPI000E569D06|nr:MULTISPECIES: protein Gly1ORF1 [Neisseria]
MKKMFLSAVLLLSAAAQTVWADTVFSCKTDNNKYIEVEKINPNLYEYSFGSMGKKEIAIRNSKADLLGRSDRWQGIGRGRWATMKFQNGKFIYTVWTSFDPVEHTESSGIIVEGGGKEIARVGCTSKTAQANFNDGDFSW